MENEESIRIIITPENKREFLSITALVSTYQRMNQNIPIALVNRLYEIMFDEKVYNFRQQWNEAEKISSITVVKINQISGYEFSWQNRTLPQKNESYIPDTKHIFSELIYAFFLYSEDHPAVGRDEAIAFMYQAFDEEYKNQLVLANQVEFSHRKQAILSGIIAMALGYQVSYNQDASNEEIFQATRNAIEKYKTRKDLFS